MAGPKTDLKDALEQSGGKLPPPEPKENGYETAVVRQQSQSRVGKKPVTVYYDKQAHLQLPRAAPESSSPAPKPKISTANVPAYHNTP